MDTRSATVLVVHDVPDYLDVLASLMRSAGFQVVRAADGSAGFDAAARHRPELVICDVAVPGLNGIDLCRALRSDDRLRGTPVLLVSASTADQASILEGFRAGADDYLEIPYEPMRLIAKVQRLIQQRRTEPPVEGLGTEGLTAGRGASAVSETVLFVESDKQVRAVARRVLAAGGYSVVEAADAVAALAICEGSGRPVDLLITGVMMYEMSGILLAETLRQSYPHMKVLYMAGYIDDIALRYKDPRGGVGVIQKPFAPDVLAEMVRTLLRQES